MVLRNLNIDYQD